MNPLLSLLLVILVIPVVFGSMAFYRSKKDSKGTVASGVTWATFAIGVVMALLFLLVFWYLPRELDFLG